MRAEYVVGEAATNLRRNVLLVLGAILAVFVSLFMTYMALVVNEVGRNSASRWQEGITIIAWLDDADLATHTAITNEVNGWSEVERAIYVGKAEAWEEFQDMFADNPALVEEVDPNAMPASVRVDLVDNELHTVIVGRLGSLGGVDGVDEASEAVEDTLEASRLLNTGGIVLGVVLGISAVVMISNTVRMAIYARREEISIMKLVGASNWFVRTPFLVEGLIEGLVGGALAVLAGWFGYRWFISNLDLGIIDTEVPEAFLLSRGLLVLLFGALAGAIGSLVGLRRYLQESK
ncbi:MAG: ABC transporter permease [Acidimicrobiia bacterium]|nr:ABC transporter permease [Acidimicrobiia bacterium]MBT8216395.1 ABC transporter permease [Acidimicrobiia bacterium]NNF09500.1 ABC transporter permease [Acidimicrobiia bacterium]NNL71036.1 ABC transporter permease [Acidimicrobiia bacterium]